MYLIALNQELFQLTSKLFKLIKFEEQSYIISQLLRISIRWFVYEHLSEKNLETLIHAETSKNNIKLDADNRSKEIVEDQVKTK